MEGAVGRQLEDARFSGTVILEIAGDESIPVTLEKASRGRRFLQQLDSPPTGHG